MRICPGGEPLPLLKGKIILRGFDEGVAGDLKNFQSEIAHEIGISAADLGRQLYGDLPPFSKFCTSGK